MNTIMKAAKYVCCLYSLAITLFILSQAILDPPEGYSLFESVILLAALIFGLVMLGGFFVMIAERKQLLQNPVKLWLYVIFVPVVAWTDILIQPEPDGSSRIKHVFKDVYKFVSYLWGYKSRAVSFLVTVVLLFYLPLDSSETSIGVKFVVPAVCAIFLFAAGLHFFSIAERKRFFVLNSKILTWLYIFFVPVVSWKEILLAPELDGSRVKSVVYDSAAIISMLAKYLLGSVASFIVGCMAAAPFLTTSADPEMSMSSQEILIWEIGLLCILAAIGLPFVYIAKRKKLFTNTKLLWLYIIFVPVVSYIDILLSRSKKYEDITPID